MFILGIIPARGGSKGIPRKNLKLLDGKPLIQYSIDEANKADAIINDLSYMFPCNKPYEFCPVVTTEDHEIAQLCLHKTSICIRPISLALDDTPAMPVIQHAMEGWEKNNCFEVDAVCVLQPTSPLRKSYDIIDAINTFLRKDASSLYSGYYMRIKHKDAVDKKGNQEHFQRNGAIFLAKRELIMQGKLWDEDVVEFEMPKSRSIDIDTMDDFEMAEAIVQYNKRR